MKATLRRGNKLLLQEGKLTRKAGSCLQLCRRKRHKIMSLLLLEKVAISTRLNDQLCSLTGLFHLLSFPLEIISSSKEGKKKKTSTFLLQDEEEGTQREGRREQRNFSNNQSKTKQQK